jgi:quercetin dioxygenase-like cupin family protein
LSKPERLWFLGTLATILVDGDATGGKLAVMEVVFPKHASPPLHTHPQGETLVLVEGRVTAVVDGTRSEVAAGSAIHAPAGTPHTFRVDSESARILVLSNPAGIERYFRDAGVPAERPTLPPADAPRPTAEENLALERAHGIERHGPPLEPGA